MTTEIRILARLILASLVLGCGWALTTTLFGDTRGVTGTHQYPPVSTGIHRYPLVSTGTHQCLTLARRNRAYDLAMKKLEEV